MNLLKIRKYKESDCETLYRLFYDTVHTVNKKDYSESQLNAWASKNPDLERWNRSFLEHFTLISETNGIITGFGDIDKTGYLDRLYTHKDYQGQGIAAKICNELEKSVTARKIFVHASVTAKPFFEKRDYIVVKEQQVLRHGVFLTNYIMEKEKKPQ